MRIEAKILLTEDNQPDIDLIKYIFKKNKIENELIIIQDGQDASDFILKTCQEFPSKLPDMIILDINLPKKSGLQILKEIKDSKHARHIPVIILTTSGSDKDIFDAYSNYVSAYLVKPVEIEDFIKMIISLDSFMFKIIKIPYAR